MALAIPTGQPEHDLAGTSDLQEVIPSTRQSASWPDFQEQIEERRRSRRSRPGARAFSWIRRQLLSCTNPSMAHARPLAEHQAANIEQGAAYVWQVTILVQGKDWFLAIYHQNDLPIQCRQAVASAVPRPDLPTTTNVDLLISYPATIKNFEAQAANYESGAANHEPGAAHYESVAAHYESVAANYESGPGDGWRRTFMEVGGDWIVVLFDRTSLVNTYIESEGFSNRQRRRLEEAERAFDSHTITSGYIPFNEQQKLHTETRHGTVSLDEASQLLATTAASQPGESDRLADSYDDGGLRFNSKLKGIQHQKTAACSHQDEPTNQDRVTESPNGSSTANPPNHYKYSHFIVGKENQNQCAVCGDQFKSPKNAGKHQWCISEVTRIKKCRHDFHPKCIRPWIIEHGNRSCPLCRVFLDDNA
ncbi:hypothetical protein, variant 1 [Puccinia triticina 1-1 BBBD Race 1]|nr:hypothetical protein, variant 1 [Puccinia triticina 1-1 BBBD Race 1]